MENGVRLALSLNQVDVIYGDGCFKIVERNVITNVLNKKLQQSINYISTISTPNILFSIIMQCKI